MHFILLGNKLGMTQIFDEENALVPVTVIEAGPCPVTQIKTRERDGYNAMQIGFGKRKRSRLKRPEKGHFSKAKVDPCSRLQEVRCVGKPEQVMGDLLTVANFQEGQKVDIVGESKGKGFQGVVKRWGFKGGPRSHGSTFHRRGGSYGQCQWPGEVYKGRKMPGRMGNVRRTVQNLRIIKILADKNLILVRGSIPGANGAKVLVRTAKKIQKSA